MNLKKDGIKITMMISNENAGKVTVEAALQINIPLPVTMNRKIKKSTVK